MWLGMFVNTQYFKQKSRYLKQGIKTHFGADLSNSYLKLFDSISEEATKLISFFGIL